MITYNLLLERIRKEKTRAQANL